MKQKQFYFNLHCKWSETNLQGCNRRISFAGTWKIWGEMGKPISLHIKVMETEMGRTFHIFQISRRDKKAYLYDQPDRELSPGLKKSNEKQGNIPQWRISFQSPLPCNSGYFEKMDDPDKKLLLHLCSIFHIFWRTVWEISVKNTGIR